MATEYRLDVRTPAGALQGRIAGASPYADDPTRGAFRSLTYDKGVNTPGMLTFVLNGQHEAASYLLQASSHNAQIEVWRRNVEMDIDWYCDFRTLYQHGHLDGEGPQATFTATCVGQMALLDAATIAYYAEYIDRSKFINKATETIMKALVIYNATSSATTANGRDVTFPSPVITVETDGLHGIVRDWSASRRPLLSELQDLALAGGGDFDLVKTGAQTWQFRWYTGQLGTDRSASVIFSRLRGNMTESTYDYDRTGERTIAIVAGQGQGAARQVVIRQGPEYATTNHRELIVDARDLDTTAGLQARGDQELADQRALPKVEFKIIQTPATFYGKHYFLGDLVRVQTYGLNDVHKVQTVSVSVDDSGGDSVDITTSEPQ